MAKLKKKLTAAQKQDNREAKAERQQKYMWVSTNGRQVKIKRPPTIEGMEVDEFIKLNADPVYLHQNEMWELLEQDGEDAPLQLTCNGEAACC